MTIREVLDQQLSPGNSLGLIALLEDVKSGAEVGDLKDRAAAWLGFLNGTGAVPPPAKKPASKSSPTPTKKK
jgi:hypothetical protein